MCISGTIKCLTSCICLQTEKKINIMENSLKYGKRERDRERQTEKSVLLTILLVVKIQQHQR